MADEREGLSGFTPSEHEAYRLGQMSRGGELEAAEAVVARYREALERAADALHDFIWILRDNPAPQPPLPHPAVLVLGSGIEAHDKARAVLGDEQG